MPMNQKGDCCFPHPSFADLVAAKGGAEWKGRAVAKRRRDSRSPSIRRRNFARLSAAKEGEATLKRFPIPDWSAECSNRGIFSAIGFTMVNERRRTVVYIKRPAFSNCLVVLALETDNPPRSLS